MEGKMGSSRENLGRTQTPGLDKRSALLQLARQTEAISKGLREETPSGRRKSDTSSSNTLVEGSDRDSDGNKSDRDSDGNKSGKVTDGNESDDILSDVKAKIPAIGSSEFDELVNKRVTGHSNIVLDSSFTRHM